jgi:hypothetical protein
MDALASLLQKIEWLQAVEVGPPENPPALTMAWVTMGEIQVNDTETVGLVCLKITLIVWFGYNVHSEESDSERRVARGVVDLTRLLVRNRMGPIDEIGRYLNGTVRKMSLPLPAAGGPDYAQMAGMELRLYPVGVTVEFVE